MGETAEYQRLQDTSEPDYQRLPSDDEEVDLYISFVIVVIVPQTNMDDTQTMSHSFSRCYGVY